MDGKFKVSFGIKTSKQGSQPKKTPSVSNDVEYIKSFDNTCKPLSSDEARKADELVIPFRGNQMKGQLEQISREGVVEEKGGGTTEEGILKPLTSMSLDQLAAQELLKAAQGATIFGNKPVDVVPLPEDQQNDAVEATLEDYESVPVEDFGKAMLRGMGWEPGKGIGKNQRVVPPSAPQLRPKGLGLGADRATPSANKPLGSGRQGAEGEEANLTIGCGVQIVAGGHGGLYGKVVSHNEDTGRCIVKLEIGGSSVSVNENLVKTVGKEEYANNCRVLNAAKYQRYKESSDERLQGMRDDAAKEEELRQSSSERRRRHRSRSPHK
ncbi:G-patch domain and KOW motifs-containing protein-like [Hetaerina americana]|uniref:G-patch domain and KOW motifs-containing protein-like n=1 Tax=Hetaerina americana TaxID=62018 RepID=UPI003A7F318D